jgi:hypothetical protein
MSFFSKVATVSFAALAVMWISTWYIISSVVDSDVLRALNGGPAFWAMVEWKLDHLADEPDVEPEKKEKIIRALSKLSAKYHPYLEALFSAPTPKQLSANK